MCLPSGSESSHQQNADTLHRNQRSLPHQLVLLFCMAVMLYAMPAAADPDARAEYRAALDDLNAARLQQFDRRLERLQDYPLLPYLHHARLMRYISSASPEDVQQFRERFADTPLADQALRQWLDNLARRGKWALYREHFDPAIATATDLQCRYYRSLYETGDQAEALAGAAEIWVAPRSLPDVCNPLFDAWRRQGGPTDEQAWARIRISLDAGNPSLASYAVRYLDEDNQALARDFIRLHRSPERLQRVVAMEGPETRIAEVVSHAVTRLSRRDPATARELWSGWQSRLDLNGPDAGQVQAELVRWQLRRDLLPANFSQQAQAIELVPEQDPSLIEELLRHAIGRQDWLEVVNWIARLPDSHRDQAGWRYWRARASLELPESRPAPRGLMAVALRNADQPVLSHDAALAELATLARERNYYGFMAARRLQQPFALHSANLLLAGNVRDQVRQQPALQRALELQALGERLDKRRELAWLRQRLDTDSLLALAEISLEQGWHDQSIHATAAARQWDQLELRFPLPFADTMQDQARSRELDPAWLYAVARQESAFMTDARSSAGALGVMQLLPATARRTARQENIALNSNWQLLDPDRNIRLGAAYLAEMKERFDGNRILATAAYNAGPNRVDRWLRERGQAPADVWIESIPFRETRGYVQNVLTYTVIYSHRLQREHPFLFSHEQFTGTDQHRS